MPWDSKETRNTWRLLTPEMRLWPEWQLEEPWKGWNLSWISKESKEGRYTVSFFRNCWVIWSTSSYGRANKWPWITTLLIPDSIFKFCSTWSSVSGLPFEPFVGGDDPAHGPCLCWNMSTLFEISQNVSWMLSILAYLHLLISLHYALVISMIINL